jgi:hypothetical protein
MEVSELRCRRCKEAKSLNEFNRIFFGKHGFDVYCHNCRIEIDKITNTIKEKQCRQCGRIQSVSEFGKTAWTRDGYSKECFDCQEQNLHRKRERKSKKVWKGEMETCTICGKLKPTYDIFPPRFKQSKTRYCRSCINLTVRQKLLEYEHNREVNGWKIQKRCKGCSRIYPSDQFHLDRRKKDGFSDFCVMCENDYLLQRFNKLNEIHKIKAIKSSTKKECSICHTLKPLSNFVKNKSFIDGYNGMCIACTKMVRKEDEQIWERLRREKGTILEKMQCKDCGRILPIEMFTKLKGRKKGYRYYCKECSHTREKKIFQLWDQQRKKEQFEFSLDSQVEKTCKICGQVLPLSKFWNREASKDGHSHYCISCASKKLKERDKKLREQGFPEERIPVEKRCSLCKRILPRAMFYKDSTTSTGLDSRCIDCRKIYDNEYNARPEVKKKKYEYCRRPEVMEKNRLHAREYQKRPEVKERVKAYKKEYKKRPYVKEKLRAYERMRYQRPKVKQKKKEYDSRPKARERRRRSTAAWRLRKKAEQKDRVNIK